MTGQDVREVAVGRRSLVAGLAATAALLCMAPGAFGKVGRRRPEVRRLPDPVHRGILIWDVAPIGYVAEEYVLSGSADVFEPTSMADAPDMSKRDNLADFLRRDFRPHLLQPAQPYATRLTVYRPADKARYSGTTFFEVLHPSGGGSALVWSRAYQSMARRGDAYIAVQPPLTVAGLRAVDKARYGTLHAVHASQLWDALADAAALGRSSGPDGLLSGLPVRRQILVGYSYTGAAVAGFKNFHHERVTQRDGRRPFDGYIPMAAAIYAQPGDVPVMRLTTQSDFGGRGGIQNRLPDSDDRAAPFRLYEVAGAAHKMLDPSGWELKPPTATVPAPEGLPNYPAETCIARFPSGSRANDLPLYLVISGALANMVQWIERNVAPPRSARLADNPDGAAQTDADGNAIGGVRLPHLSVPAATYGVGTDRCQLFGYTHPFTRERMRERYGTRSAYREKAVAAVDTAIADRWIEPQYRRAMIDSCDATAEF